MTAAPSDRLSWKLLLFGTALLPVSTMFFLPCWLLALGICVWRERPSLQDEGMKWLAVLTVGLIIVTVLSYKPELSLGGLFNYLPFFLFFWLIARLVNSPERLRQILLWGLVGATATGTAGVFEWITGINWQWKILGPLELAIGSRAETGILERVTSFFFWPTTAAAYLVLVVPAALTLAIGSKEVWLRSVGYYTWLMTFIAQIGTASRNAWVVSTLGLVAVLLYTRRWILSGVVAVIGFSILTAAIGPESWPIVPVLRRVVPTYFSEKLGSTLDTKAKAYESTSDRLEAWHIAEEMLLARPLTGWGPQTFPFVGVEVYHKKALTIHAHNLYLTYWTELGFPLGSALLAFFVMAIVRATRALNRLPDFLRWGMVGVVISLGCYGIFGLFDVPFYDARVNAQLWLWCALCWHLPILFPEKIADP